MFVITENIMKRPVYIYIYIYMLLRVLLVRIATFQNVREWEKK